MGGYFYYEGHEGKFLPHTPSPSPRWAWLRRHPSW